ncbi:condensation domain-containing protein [Dactylosporangium sp. CA-139066]|uniref:condensation domain-containing protein n=1 Tax=Dactylosporangium sp. CA-139066 TaxID=3239930 RepID=UPI003D94CB0F
MDLTPVDVPFSAADSGEGEAAVVAELTWGQRAMVAAMRRERSWMPMGGHRPVPPGTTVADVAAELRYTLERYQSFRTRLVAPQGHSAWSHQVVAASGVARLDVAEADGSDPNDVAAVVESFYRSTTPDLTTDWPSRMAVICQHGTPARMVAIMPHLVTDGLGAAIMIDEVTRRLTTPVEGLRPLDIVEWQSSAAGIRQHTAALRHWERHAPSLGSFAPERDAPAPRYRKCVLESPRLAARLPQIAARTGVDESTVLLAAYFAALSQVTGHATIAVRQVVSNRFRRELSTVVSPITQLGLCVVDSAAGFDDVIARVARAALPARKYAYYDPFAIPDVATACFNDRRTTGAAATAFGDPAKADRPGVAEWLAPPPGPTEPLFLHADDVPGAVRLTLDVDTACFSPAEIEAVAYGIEAVVGSTPVRSEKP